LPFSEGPLPIPPQLQAYASKLPSLKEALVNPVSLGELVCEELIYSIENAPLSDHETSGLSFPAPEGLSFTRDHLGFGASKEKQR
jgi:hypothetical protein